MGSSRARSVYLTTRLLGRLSPLSGYPVLCTFFRQKLTTSLLESAEGGEWPQKIFHDQSPRKNVGWGWTRDLLVSSRTAHPTEPTRTTKICTYIGPCIFYFADNILKCFFFFFFFFFFLFSVNRVWGFTHFETNFMGCKFVGRGRERRAREGSYHSLTSTESAQRLQYLRALKTNFLPSLKGRQLLWLPVCFSETKLLLKV